MIFDKLLMFDDNVSHHTNGTKSTAIDLGKGAIGKGTKVRLYAQLNTLVGGTTPTVKAELQKSPDSTDGNYVTILSGVAINAVGTLLDVDVPATDNANSYYRILYTTTGTPTDAKVTAGLILN